MYRCNRAVIARKKSTANLHLCILTETPTVGGGNCFYKIILQVQWI